MIPKRISGEAHYIRLLGLVGIILLSCIPLFAHDDNSDVHSSKTTALNKEKRIVFSSSEQEGSVMYSRYARIYSEAFRRLGYDFMLLHVQPARALVDANDGITDGDGGRIYELNKTNRYPHLIRVNEPIVELTLQAYTLYPDIRIHGFESLRNKPYSVGYRRGIAVFEQNLPKYLLKDNIVAVTNNFKGLQMLLAGKIDILAAGDISSIEIELEKHEFNNKGIVVAGKFKKIVLYPYLHRKNKPLVPLLEVALRQMKRDGTFEALRKDSGP